MLINELKRALKSKKNIGVIIMMIFINLYSIYKNTPHINEFFIGDISTKDAVNYGYLNQFTLFRYANVQYIIFIPLTCSFVFGLSFLQDRKKGFNKFINLRISNFKYCFSKFLANGIVGGLSAALPSIVVFYFLNVFIGGSINDTQLANGGIFEALLQTNPYIFILVFFIMEFLIGFTYSTIALSVSTLLDNEILVLLSPGAFYYITNYVTEVLRLPLKFKTKIATEFGMLAGGVTGYEIVIQLILITVIFGSVFFYNSRKEFVYEK